MFGKNKSDKKKHEATPGYQVGSVESLVKVHTMPEKFLLGQTQPKKPRYFVIALIGIVLVGIVGAVTIVVLGKVLQPQVPTAQTPDANVNSGNANSADTNQQTNINSSDNQVVRVDVQDGSGQIIGSASLIIPQGALENDVQVDIVGFPPDRNTSGLEGYNISHVVGGVYSFTPDGLKFKKPVTLILTYEMSELQKLNYKENDLKIGFGQALDNWELIGETEIDSSTKSVSVVLRDLVSQGKYGIVSINAIKSEKEEENINTNSNSNTNATLEFESEGLVPASADSDGDKLTDVEEDLLKTAVNQPDTDRDGFTDGQEVLLLYDPLTPDGGLLKDSSVIEKYQQPTIGYTVVYPKSWVANSLDEQGEKVYFTSATGEFIQILSESNPSGLTAVEWYSAQVPEVNTSQLEKFTVHDLEAVKSVDGRTVYIGGSDRIFIISYNIGLRKDMNFYTVFMSLVSSFQRIKPIDEQGSNVNTGINANTGNTNQTANKNNNSETNGNGNTNNASNK